LFFNLQTIAHVIFFNCINGLKKGNNIERKTTKVLLHIIQMAKFFKTYLLN